MSFLPIILREDNFPQINFRKLAANRNKKIYLFLNAIKGVFLAASRKPQKIEKRIIESLSEDLKVSLQADYKIN